MYIPLHISNIGVLNNPQGPAFFCFLPPSVIKHIDAQTYIDWMANEKLLVQPLQQQGPINALFVFGSAATANTALLWVLLFNIVWRIDGSLGAALVLTNKKG